MTESTEHPSCLASVAKNLRNHYRFTGSDEEVLEDVLQFLNYMGEPNRVNLYGAGIAIVYGFHTTGKQAQELLGYWMRTFAERHPKPTEPEKPKE